MLPEIVTGLAAHELQQTARAIAALQEPDGAIPAEPGGRTDPWNHVEALMGLDVGGQHAAVERGFEWLLRNQNADGTWAATYRQGAVLDGTVDVNFTAYCAAGAWHHYLATLDDGFLADVWPAIDRALEFTIGMQAAGGEIWWARDPRGRIWPGALVTSSSCVHLSLRCGLACAERLGREKPHWHQALSRLGDAIRSRPESFEPKERYAMDWYYPVLGGAITEEQARARLEKHWGQFVVEGLGSRCVADRPWVTVAETSELVIALDVAGLTEEAARVFSWLSARRDPGGAYWTGITFPELVAWPEEQPAWTAAAVLLAADALAGEGLTAGFFRDEMLPDEVLEAAG